MSFMDFLASVLNPNPGVNRLVGGQGGSSNYLSQTGAAPQGMPMAAPQAMQPQASPMPAPMATASVAPPQPSGGGIGGFLGGLFGGGGGVDQQKLNHTISWLQTKGMDPQTAEAVAGNKDLLQSYLREQMKPQTADKPFEINGKLVDPHDYHVLADFSTPKEENKPADIVSYEYAKSQGYKGTLEEWQTKGVRTQGKEFSQYQDTRKEIQALPSYKKYVEAVPAYNSMLKASGRNTKAADLNLVYGLAKIFDPTSVVREGEIVMANDTQGVADRLNGIVKGISGQGALQPEARKALLDEARSRMEEFKTSYDSDLGQYNDMAANFGLDPKFLIPRVPDMGAFPEGLGAPPPAPGGLPLPPPAGQPAPQPAPQPSPQPAPQGGDLSTMPPPPGMDPKTWKFMPPESRKLWLQ